MTWPDAVALCDAMSTDLAIGKTRIDAVLGRRLGRPRITVSDRVHRDTWGVFSVVHELAHHVLHPAKREFYLGSPGWYSRTESQANVLALLALWPHAEGPPYPRFLQITAADDALISFHLAVTTAGTPRWTSRRMTLQRYR